MHVKLSLSLHFCLFYIYLLLNSCDGNDAKHNALDYWWLWKEPVLF